MSSSWLLGASLGTRTIFNLLSSGQRRSTLYGRADTRDEQAEDAFNIAEDRAAQLRRRSRRLISQQRASLAGSNVDLSSGTATDFQRETLEREKQEIDRIQTNAWRRAMGYQEEADILRKEAGRQSFSLLSDLEHTLSTASEYQRRNSLGAY